MRKFSSHDSSPDRHGVTKRQTKMTNPSVFFFFFLFFFLFFLFGVFVFFFFFFFCVFFLGEEVF